MRYAVGFPLGPVKPSPERRREARLMYSFESPPIGLKPARYAITSHARRTSSATTKMAVTATAIRARNEYRITWEVERGLTRMTNLLLQAMRTGNFTTPAAKREVT